MPILVPKEQVKFRFSYDETGRRTHATLEFLAKVTDGTQESGEMNVAICVRRDEFPDAWLPAGTVEVGMRGD